MTTIFPKAHKIIKPPSLRPIRTDTTDIRKTFAAERKRLAAAETCKVVKLPALVVEDPVVSGRAVVVFPHNLPRSFRHYRKD